MSVKFVEAEKKEQDKKAADEVRDTTENETSDEALNETENQTESQAEHEAEKQAAEQYEYGGYQIRIHFSGEKTLVQCIKNLTERKNICRYP